jgi:5-methylcytosine-specific restriction enzyme A
MSLEGLTREGVLAALRECDELGREAFLKRYGYRKARDYPLVYEGEEYDSKAIAGVAYGFDHPSEGPLRWDQFSGGAVTVAPVLRALGFEVRGGGNAVVLQTRDAVHARRALPELNSERPDPPEEGSTLGWASVQE